jgi:hypothetical protein
VLVSVTSDITTSTSSTSGAMSFAISGGDTVAASDGTALILTPNTSQAQSASATYVVSGLTPGAVDTFTAMYKAPGPTSATATFEFRQIWAMPLP